MIIAGIVGNVKWCWWRGLNSRPSVYKTAALPLCYTSKRPQGGIQTPSTRNHTRPRFSQRRPKDNLYPDIKAQAPEVNTPKRHR
jgi:hypothetical protein